MKSLFSRVFPTLPVAVFLLGVFFPAPLLAVDCSSADITLDTQAEVNSFQATYGPCDTVTGLLHVLSNASVANLDGLSALTNIGGDLAIAGNSALTDVSGLAALTSVGGYVSFNSNAVLPNLDGLSALASVGQGLSVSLNPLMTNIDDLSALETVGGFLIISQNAILGDLDGLSSLASVGLYMEIANNPALTNIDGLSALATAGSVSILSNAVLTDLDGLSSLTNVDAELRIENNTGLTNIDGLSALTSVGGFLSVSGNTLLPDIDGLAALTAVGGFVSIEDNPVLTNLDGLAGLTSVPQYFFLQNNSLLADIGGLAGISTIGGDVRVEDNPVLLSLDGFSALTGIGGSLIIANNDGLSDIDGLSALTSVGLDLIVEGNALLADLNELRNLISVGEDVVIQSNPLLGQCFGLTALLNDVDDGAPGPGPGSANVPDVAGDVTILDNGEGCNSVQEILVDRPAQFSVTKDFVDDNPSSVKVMLDCNTGLLLDQSKVITEAQGVVFVVTEFDSGELDCSVTEEDAFGYVPEYDDGTSINAIACDFTNLQSGAEVSCQITNTPAPVTVTVNKSWQYPDNGNSGAIDTSYELFLECDTLIEGGDPIGGGSYRAHVQGEGDQSFDFTVYPVYSGNVCQATETVYDNAVEPDNSDCQDIVIGLGQGAECTIVNTVFFEGIPTLNRFGAIALVVLLLALGLTGLRFTRP